MKLKVLIAAALSATLVLSASANAAEAETKNSINYTINIEKSSGLNGVAGFIAEIKYNAKALVPKLCGVDLLGDDIYANQIIDKGILSADLITDSDGNNIIVVGWADKSETQISDDNLAFAEIEFDVLDNAEADDNGCTTISSKISSISTSKDTMTDIVIENSDNFEIVTPSYNIPVSDSVESDSSVIVPDTTESGSALETLMK